MMRSNTSDQGNAEKIFVPEGRISYLYRQNSEDLRFVRDAYGYEAEEKGWFRERDRLFVFTGTISERNARKELKGDPPPSILDVPAPSLPNGPVSQRLLTMEDGTAVRWIRHPCALPKSCQSHWRNHTALFEIKGKNPDFECYTSIFCFAFLESADGKFRIFAPGGIRWIGNERGVAGYPCWSTVKKLNDPGAGDPDGKIWNPGECDVPLPGHGWFWKGQAKPGKPSDPQQQKTLDRLMDMYYRSVGRNCNLLLNTTPDTTGLIPEAILPHYANFGKEIRRRFDRPVAETKGEGDTVELELKKPAQIDHVMIMEDIAYGERVRAYEVEGLVPGNTWQKLCDGASIGHKRIQKFNRTEVARIRFHATKAVAVPNIRRLAVFSVG